MSAAGKLGKLSSSSSSSSASSSTEIDGDSSTPVKRRNSKRGKRRAKSGRGSRSRGRQASLDRISAVRLLLLSTGARIEGFQASIRLFTDHGTALDAAYALAQAQDGGAGVARSANGNYTATSAAGGYPDWPDWRVVTESVDFDIGGSPAAMISFTDAN
jgi:hypothetical protein